MPGPLLAIAVRGAGIAVKGIGKALKTAKRKARRKRLGLPAETNKQISARLRKSKK